MHLDLLQGQENGLQCLIFRVGSEYYAVDIHEVRELRDFERPTALANAPAFLLGVIHLRGLMVPIVDMRIRLGQTHPPMTPFTVVVIVQLGINQAGLVVDGVSDVRTFAPHQRRPAPHLGSAVDASVRGVITDGDQLITLLNLEAWTGMAARLPKAA